MKRISYITVSVLLIAAFALAAAKPEEKKPEMSPHAAAIQLVLLCQLRFGNKYPEFCKCSLKTSMC